MYENIILNCAVRQVELDKGLYWNAQFEVMNSTILQSYKPTDKNNQCNDFQFIINYYADEANGR
jgi:hypothetical protein